MKKRNPLRPAHAPALGRRGPASPFSPLIHQTLNPGGLNSTPAMKTATNISNAERALSDRDQSVLDAYREIILSYRAGDFAKTLERCGHVLDIYPDHAKVLNIAANVAFGTGALDQSFDYFRRLIALDPSHAEAHAMTGHILGQRGEYEAAAVAYRAAIAISPHDADVFFHLGLVLQEGGNFAPSIGAYERTVGLEPHHHQAWLNLGAMRQVMGDMRGARAAFRQAIEIKPDYAEAHRLLASLKTFRKDDGDIAAMRKLLAGPATSDAQAVHLRFALAKAHEDLQDYDTSFAHLTAGNRLKRAMVDFNIRDHEAYGEKIIAAFDKERILHLRGHGHPSGQCVFIIGMPRSGTTLIEQILAAHSRIFGAGEIYDLEQVIQDFGRQNHRDAAFPDYLEALKDGELRRMGETYSDMQAARAGKAGAADTDLWINKTPANFLFVGLIHAILPNAKVIHCRRDPMDVGLSCYKKLFRRGVSFSYDLDDIAGYYKMYSRLMDHWARLLPGFVLDVDYEAVVSDLEGQTRRMLDFCGLGWQDACRDFHQNRRPVQTASNAQVRRPLYGGAVKYWKHFESHLTPLRDALGKAWERS